MNNRILSLVMLLVGVGFGIGVGILISKPKIDESRKELDQLVVQMQTSKEESEKTIQRAASVIARKEKELKQVSAQLAAAETQLRQLKNESSVVSMPSEGSQQQPVVMPTPTGTAGTAPTAATQEYTVAEGDSLWEIAEKQLGNGLRYKEILKFNPDLSENDPLTVGMKIKIPAQ